MERRVRYTVDLSERTIEVETEGKRETFELYSPRGFEVLSRAWLTVGWSLKYSYQFTWLGRPIIQLPEDMVRLQELIYQAKPDVIVETGVAHGGNQVFLASLCRLLGRGRVIGVDIEIRPHNRAALENHELHSLITLIEGSSTDPAVVEQVRAAMGTPDKVLILLDANHTKPARLGADRPLAMRRWRTLLPPFQLLLAHRRLIWQLALHELRGRYAATLVGSLWAIVNPLVVILVFWFVSAYGLKITFESGPPFHLVLFCGLVPWMTFNEAVSGGTSAVLSHAYLVKKIASPLEILPVVGVTSAVIVHGFLLAVLLGILLLSGVTLTIQMLQVAYFLLALVVTAGRVGLLGAERTQSGCRPGGGRRHDHLVLDDPHRVAGPEPATARATRD